MATMSYDAFLKMAGSTTTPPKVIGNETSSTYKKSVIPQPQSPAVENPTPVDNPVPGSDSSWMPANPAVNSEGKSQLGIKDALKVIPNAVKDAGSIIKESTYGTAKKIAYDIPKEAFNLFKEQGAVEGAKNIVKSIPESVAKTLWGFVPESAKQLMNTDAISKIPEDLKQLADQKGGYINALKEVAKNIPESVVPGVTDFVDHIDRARQAFENHPIFETLGYAGLRGLAEHPIQSVKDAVNAVKTTAKVIGSPLEAASGVISDMKNIAGNIKNKVIDKVGDTTIAPFKKSFDPKIAKEFADEGIDAPVSAVSKSPFIKGMEAVASKSAFGQGIIDRVNKASTDIENKANQIVEKLKPVKTISDENLGKTLQEGLNEYEHKFKVTEDKVYEDFSKRYGKSNSTAINTKDVLGEIIEQQGADYFKGTDPALSRMLDRLTGETPQIKAIRKSMAEDGFDDSAIAQATGKMRKEPELTFKELKATRTSIGEQLARDPQNTALKRLYGALSRDMSSAVEGTDAAGAASLQKLNAKYKAGKDKIESRIAQSIDQSNPERIAQNLITRNSADTLATVKEMVGEKRFEEVSKAFLRQTLENSVTRGKFDVDKLKSNLAEYDKETLGEVLNPEQSKSLSEAITQLEKLKRLSDAMKTGQKYSQGSQTAFLNNITGMGGRAAGVFSALLSGNIVLAAGILFETGAEAGYAKLFTTQLGKQLLTEGLKPFKIKGDMAPLEPSVNTEGSPLPNKESSSGTFKYQNSEERKKMEEKNKADSDAGIPPF